MVIATVMGAAILAAGSFVFVSVREAVAVALLDTALTATHSDASPLSNIARDMATQATFENKLMTEARLLDDKIDNVGVLIQLTPLANSYCADARAGNGSRAASDASQAATLLTRFQQINGVGYPWPRCTP